MRVRGLVEYLGTKWAGWQFQPGQPTVQGEIERALSIVAGWRYQANPSTPTWVMLPPKQP